MQKEIKASRVKLRTREENHQPIYRSKAILTYQASDAKHAIATRNGNHIREPKTRHKKVRLDHDENISISSGSFDSEEESLDNIHEYTDESYSTSTEHQSDRSFETSSFDQQSPRYSHESRYIGHKTRQKRREPHRKRAKRKPNDMNITKRCKKLLLYALGVMVILLSGFVILIKTGVMDRLLQKWDDKKVKEISDDSQSLYPSTTQITSPSISPSYVPSETPTNNPTFGIGSWKEISIIQGEELYGMLGRSISFDSSGKYIAISSGFNVPKVTVYRAYYDVWIAVGQPFIGPSGSEGEYFGSSIKLVNEGTIVAMGNMFHNNTMGIVQVFSWDISRTQWSQLGQDLTGNKTNDGFGRSIELSNSGNKMCIGSALIDDGAPGLVECFHLNENSWIRSVSEQGGEMHAISSNDRGLAMTHDGSFFAYTAPGVSIHRDDASYVKVFRWDVGIGFNSKEMIGSSIMTLRRPLAIDLVQTSDQYLILAVGTPELKDSSGAVDTNGNGGVRVYFLDLSDPYQDWMERGDLIICNDCGTNFGRRLSLSFDGSALAISSNTAVMFYDWIGSKWKERGHPTTSRVFQSEEKSIPNIEIGSTLENGITLAMALSLDEDGYGGNDRGKVKFYHWN